MEQRTGRLYIVADTLSRLPIKDTKDLEAYWKLCSVDFDGEMNQSCHGETWLRKVNIVHAHIDSQEIEILNEGGKTKKFFAAAEFSKTQIEDETIATLIQLKKKIIALATSEKSKASNNVRRFLRDTEKMTLSDDDVLYRHTTDKQQLVLLKKLIPLVFTELQVKMRHLAQDLTEEETDSTGQRWKMMWGILYRRFAAVLKAKSHT